MQEKNSKTKSS